MAISWSLYSQLYSPPIKRSTTTEQSNTETAVSERTSRSRVRTSRTSRTRRDRNCDSSDSESGDSRRSGRRNWCGHTDSRKRPRTESESEAPSGQGYGSSTQPHGESAAPTDQSYYDWLEARLGREGLPPTHPRALGRSPPSASQGRAPTSNLAETPPAESRMTTTAQGESRETAHPDSDLLTTAHENQETDSTRPEILSIRASNSEIDSDSQDESASQVSAATQSVVHGDVDETGPHTSRSQSEQPARESGFSECIAAVYKELTQKRVHLPLSRGK